MGRLLKISHHPSPIKKSNALWRLRSGENRIQPMKQYLKKLKDATFSQAMKWHRPLGRFGTTIRLLVAPRRRLLLLENNMKIKITNKRHLGELQIVFAMLEKQGLRPQNLGHDSIVCEVPNKKWFKSIKQAVEFMTGCQVKLEAP